METCTIAVQRRKTCGRVLPTLLAAALVFMLGAAARAEVSTLYSFGAPYGEQLNGVLDTSDGYLYASAQSGGAFNKGAIVRFTRWGTVTVLHSFRGPDGQRPVGQLTLGRDGALYGITSAGGRDDYGTAFRIARSGGLTTLHSFSSDEGGASQAGLALASDGHFYGVTAGVYSYSQGTTTPVSFGCVFRMTSSGAVTVLHRFDGASEGAQPLNALLAARDGQLYGTTSVLRSFGPRPFIERWGTVFRMSLDGTFSTLHTFTGVDGANPSRLVQTADGALYGVSAGATQLQGFPSTAGTVFKFDGALAFSTLHQFSESAPEGREPSGSLLVGQDGNLYGATTRGGQNQLGSFFRVTPAGELTVLHPFTIEDGQPAWSLSSAGADFFYTGSSNLARITPRGEVRGIARVGFTVGALPAEAPMLASDGSYYGTTTAGGQYGYGGVYRLNLSGVPVLLVSFRKNEQAGALVEGADGALYCTGAAGERGAGSILRVTKRGTLSTWYSFDGTTGSQPEGPLVVGADGSLTGTAAFGGARASGTIFRLSRTRQLTTLYEQGPDAYGVNPLLRASDGSLYGTSQGGGAFSYYGTVFRLADDGQLTTLYSFDGGSAGGMPGAGLVQGSDGSLYGTTGSGGAYGAGTVFRITTAGELTTLYSFQGGPGDGGWPEAKLAQARDGSFYGTTRWGGANGAGNAFRLSAGGVYSNLGSFAAATPENPFVRPSGLAPARNGSFYGAALYGGAYAGGSIFVVR